MINKTVKGNLISMGLNGDFDIIIHGANCFCIMGSGIAFEIKNRCPSAYRADCNTKQGDLSKLGDFTSSLIENKLMVINAYTQFEPGRNCNYVAIKNVFEHINRIYKNSNFKFGIPMIGAGIAGGDWKIISEIINKETPDLDITLVEYDGSK